MHKKNRVEKNQQTGHELLLFLKANEQCQQQDNQNRPVLDEAIGQLCIPRQLHLEQE